MQVPHDVLCLILDACPIDPRPWRLALRLVASAWRAAHRCAVTPLLAPRECERAVLDYWWSGPLCPGWVARAAAHLCGGDLAALLAGLCHDARLCDPPSALLLAARCGRADIVRDMAQRAVWTEPPWSAYPSWVHRAVVTAAAEGHHDVLDALAGAFGTVGEADARRVTRAALVQAIGGLHAGAVNRLARPPFTQDALPEDAVRWDVLVTAIGRAGPAGDERAVATLDRLARPPFAVPVDWPPDTPCALLFTAAARGLLGTMDRLSAVPYGFGAAAAAWCVDMADEIPAAARERLSRAPFRGAR